MSGGRLTLLLTKIVPPSSSNPMMERALVPIPKRSTKPVSDIDTGVVDKCEGA
jgi:hypothetical protein